MGKPTGQVEREGGAGIQIARIDAWAVRQPLERPIATSFGTMHDRPAVFVRLENSEGCFGWGEVFANWPAAGAEHRVNLLMQDVADFVFETKLEAPSDLFNTLDRATHIRALQCGEWGPFRQVIAGLDIAAWDLFARRAGIPVRQLLNPEASERVTAYASGIHIKDADELIERARQSGFANFKVKVGFDLERDAASVNALASGLAEGERLFADANQAWDLKEATSFLNQVARAGIGWLEEPIPADAPEQEWCNLASTTQIPLAGGENIAGQQDFAAAIKTGALLVVQPDIAKWGGFTGCFAVARDAIAASRLYCPHFLGGGIGLAASAHLLAAAGGEGLLEVDVNPNELRDGFGPAAEKITNGEWLIEPGPGLGIEQLPEAFSTMTTLSRTRSL